MIIAVCLFFQIILNSQCGINPNFKQVTRPCFFVFSDEQIWQIFVATPERPL